MDNRICDINDIRIRSRVAVDFNRSKKRTRNLKTYIGVMNHPILKLSLWMGETTIATIVSYHLNFDMADFRVWTLWTISAFAGLVQIIGRKNIVAWWNKIRGKNE